MLSNPRVDSAPSSHGKTLVVAGRWNVPPEERPPGWEALLVPEADGTLINGRRPAPPVPEKEPEPQTIIRRGVEVPAEKPQPKWGEFVDASLKLQEGKTATFKAPKGMGRGTFVQELRRALAIDTRSYGIEWAITTAKLIGDSVLVKNCGSRRELARGEADPIRLCDCGRVKGHDGQCHAKRPPEPKPESKPIRKPAEITPAIAANRDQFRAGDVIQVNGTPAPTETPASSTVPTPSNSDLRAQLIEKFPSFDQGWSDAVKIKWFETFTTVLSASGMTHSSH